MKTPDIAIAVRFYYEKTELASADIKQIFSCGGATATKLKKEVQNEMAKEKIRTWLPGIVNTRLAYKVWGIDIADFEKRLEKINKIARLVAK